MWEEWWGNRICLPVGKSRLTPLPSVETWLDRPMVSLLCAAWNEEKNLENFLRSYVALDYPHKELLLCVGGEDGSYEIAAKWADAPITLLLQNAGEGKFSALQRCLAQTSGTIVMLTDADCILNSDSFNRLIYPIILGEETVTTGALQPFSDKTLVPFVACQWLYMHYGLLSSMVRSESSPFLVGQNSALVRRVVEEAYNTTLRNQIGEDTYLALYVQKAGHRILRVPDSYVETRFPETFMQYVRQRSRWRRDQLLQHCQAGNRRIIWKGGVSICKHLLWLLLPFLSSFLGTVGLVIWLLIWGYTYANYVHRIGIGKRAIALYQEAPALNEAKFSIMQIWGVLKLMFAESCAVIHLGIYLAVPAWRYRW